MRRSLRRSLRHLLDRSPRHSLTASLTAWTESFGRAFRRRALSGLATAVAFSAVTLTAACSSGGDAAPTTPPPTTPPPVVTVSVTVAPSALAMVSGSTGQLSAAVVNSNGVVASPSVTWSSSDAAVATVSGSGATAIVTAVAAGSATITANSGGVTGVATVTVSAPVAPTVVTMTATDASASEVGSDPGSVTITRTGATTSALPVTFTLGGSATNGTDYVTVSNSVTIPVGQSAAIVPIVPLADALVEGPETVVATLAAGAYVVGTPNSATVTVADAVPAPAPGALVSSFTHTGRIAASAQTDRWTFTANQGETIVVAIGEITGSAEFLPYIRVISPTGAQLAADWGASAGQVTLNATATGTYTVLVASNDSRSIGVGDYRLTMIRAPGTQTVSPGDEGGAATNGATHLGRLVLGDVDAWTFTASQGDYLVASIGEITGNADFVPWVRVISPSGALVGTDWSSAAAQVSARATATGEYTIIVGTNDGGSEGTGDYRLSFIKAPGVQFLSNGDEGGDIGNGTTRTGTLLLGDVDHWTINATQGDLLVASVGEITGNASFVPWLRIIGPSGQLHSSDWNASAAQAFVSAPSTGVYTVLMGTNDAGGNGTGDYRITVAKAPGAFTVSPGDEGGPMTNGVNHSGTLLLGDLDQWSISASQGDYLVVSVGELTGNASFVPWVRIVGPNGAVVSSNWNASAAQASVSASATGVYTILVGSNDAGSQGTGTYVVTAARAPGAISVSAGDESGTIVNGDTQNASITIGDVDQWSFTANQGELIAVRLGEVTGNADFTPWVRLVAPNGQLIVQDWGATTAGVSADAPSNGTYTVIVSTNDGGYDGTGQYQLTVAKAPGAFVVPTGDDGGGTAIGASPGGTVTVGDLDMWSFAGVQGSRITVTMTELTSSAAFVPWIRLVAPNGALVANNWGASSATVTVTLNATGTFTVIVGSNDNGTVGTGTYRLTFGTASLVAPGSVRATMRSAAAPPPSR